MSEKTSPIIGSIAYLQWYRTCCLSEKEKLARMMEQLGAWIDGDGMLQLTGPGKLAELPPHSEWYACLRKSVQRVYKGDLGLNQDELGHKLHLFRSYLDRQNIQYIRRHYSGASDFDKLVAYAAHTKVGIDFSVGANYHNRTMGPFDYPRNMKVLVPKRNTGGWRYNTARMSEFILDSQTGRFVSQWNDLKLKEDGYDANPKAYQVTECGDVANTESFNYGVPHGHHLDRATFSKAHRYLDVDHPPDLRLRRIVCRKWKSEPDFDKGGRYADIVKKGQVDLIAWRQIPLEEKPTVYEAFVRDCQRRRRNAGFGKYWRRQMRPRWLRFWGKETI